MGRTLGAPFVALSLAAVALVPCTARAGDPKHVLELEGGTKLEGKILVVTKKHVVLDAPGRPRFVERSQVSRAVDQDGTKIELADYEKPETRGALGIVVKKLNDILVHRGDETIKVEIFGGKAAASTLVRSGDELITGATGNVTLVIPGDAQVFARLDADVVFQESGPDLREGFARVEGADVILTVPEGKIHARDAIVEAEHIKDRTQIRCFGGTCEVAGRDWKLVLHRNDVIDVANTVGERPPYIGANATNTTPIWVELWSGKRIRLDHGEKVYLSSTATAPEPRATREAHEPPPREPDRTPPQADTGLGTITRADADLQLTRAGHAYTVAVKEAPKYALKKGDEIATEEGTATLSFADQTELELGTHTTLVLYPEDSPLMPFRLARGSVSATPSGRLGIVVPQGEVALRDGPAKIRLSPASVQVSVPQDSKGRAGLLVKPEVRADLRSGTTLVATSAQGEVKLEALAGSAASDVTLTRVDATLRAGRAIAQSRMDDGALAITVWNDARLELEGSSLSATIVEEGSDVFAYLTDGRRIRLEPGKPTRVGEKGVEPKPLPKPEPEKPLVPTQPPPQPDPGVTARKPGRDVQKVRLPNGAELTLVNWGKLEQSPSPGNCVEVVGPGRSPLVFGANTKATLARQAGAATVTTGDKRRLVWNEGANTLPFEWRLAEDGKLTLTIDKNRTLAVDAGKDFEIELRDNGSVPATISQNTVFVRLGDDIRVDEKGCKIINKQIDMAKGPGDGR